MAFKFTAVITKEGRWYIAHCLELEVVSQGETIEEAKKNLQEAVELYLESFGDEDLPQTTDEVFLSTIEVRK